MPNSKLLDRVREEVRLRGMSRSTEESYSRWVRRYVLFHGKRHPQEMGTEEVRGFLVHLAVEGDVAASTQNQALAALLFLYRHVLDQQLDDLGKLPAAKRPARLPTVFTREEARAVLGKLKGRQRLMAGLLYGSGLRLMECLRRQGHRLRPAPPRRARRQGCQGPRDHAAGLHLRATAAPPLERVKLLHEQDLGNGFGSVYLPHALARNYPNAPKEWTWQYVFPSGRISRDSRARRRTISPLPRCRRRSRAR